MNKTWCAYPFKHIMVKQNGRIKPCCRFTPSEIKTQVSSLGQLPGVFKHSPELKKIRRDMINGVPVKGCEKCYYQEENNVPSMRQNAFDLFTNDNDVELEGMELAIGRICNLRCVMCNSDLSSQWLNDDKAIGRRVNSNIPTQLDIENIPEKFLKNLKLLKITGGEPFLHKGMYEFLKKMKDTDVLIYTNSTIFPEEDYASLPLSNLRIMLSIDAYGEKNSYIRHPSKWNEVEEIALKWYELSRQHEHVEISLASTISTYNVLYMNELFDWALEKLDGVDLSRQYVYTPANLSLNELPVNVKQRVEKVLEEQQSKYDNTDILKTYEQMKNICRKHDTTLDDTVGDFFAFNDKLDNLRGLCFADTFPEMYEILTHE